MKQEKADKPLFIRLGSGQAASLGVGNKGALLDRAARSGLPVPPGLILLDAAWQQTKAEGLVYISGQTVTTPEVVKLLDALQLPSFKGLLAVRSAFSAEDRLEESLAGFFTSKLFVPGTPPEALAQALSEVWASALRREGEFRRDVLLMEMVAAEYAGVAFTETEFEDDLVNYTSGTAETLVSGQVAGETLPLPKLRAWERPSAAVPSFAPRLQLLLKAIRRHFGSGDWDIEWADDGRQCWLVQIRPITRPARRNEAFTIANHKEILPELPSPFMTSLIASCAPGLFAYYHRFDKNLPARRPFIEIFYGRPYINLSLLTEMMRHLGLPTRLVSDSVGGEQGEVYGLNLGRLAYKLPVLARMGLAQLGAVTSAERAIAAMLSRTEQPGATLSENIETLRWLYTLLVTEMFSLTAAMSGPLALLRRLGVLAEHNARQRTLTTEMFTDLEPLRQMTAERPEIQAALRAGRLPADEAFRQAWQAYLKKHGHRGVYESDIARPRLHEAPQATLESLLQPLPARSELPPRTWRGWLTLPLWWQAGRAIRARERLRYHAMLGFDRIRCFLVGLAQAQANRNRLPEAEALWLLEIEEAQALEQDWLPEVSFFSERRAALERLQRYQLPDLLYRFEDLEQYQAGRGGREEGSLWRGISLTAGEIQGRAWVLLEPETRLPEGFRPEQTILVARAVDAGWILTFSQVAGVVVEIGGDLSHGSIILREIGLPAITNVRGVTGAIQTGERLALRAGVGVVERL
jgi:pyruvate,water dikinase